MADVEKMKRIKNAHLSHVSRAINSLQDALNEDEPDVETVRLYLEMLEDKYDKVQSDSDEIQELLTDDSELTKESEDMYELEEKVRKIKRNAQRLLKEILGDSGIRSEADALNTTTVNSLREQLREETDRRR